MLENHYLLKYYIKMPYGWDASEMVNDVVGKQI